MTAPADPNAARDAKTVSLKEKLSYGIGSLPFELAVNAIKHLGGPIYNMVLHLDPGRVGLVFMLIRIWDAFTDPFMGNLSDNARTRWGRRRPFILAGAVASGIIFTLIWWVPKGMHSNFDFLFYYFLIMATFHYTAVTVLQVPYNAMGYEMTPDYHERTGIFAYRMFFGQIAKLMMPSLFFLCQLEIFRGDTMTGVKWVSAGVGIVIVLFILPTVMGVKEGKQQQASKQERVALLKAIAMTLKNHPFLILVGLTFVTIFGSNFVMSLGNYVNVYYVAGGDKKFGAELQMYGTWAGTITSFLSIPAFAWLSKRYGKIRMLSVCIGSVAIGSFLTWFAYDPRYPYLQIIVYPFLFLGDTGFWLFITSMKADICDWDEWKTGLRREGMYGAATGWFQKMTQAFTFGGALIMLGFIGFDAAKEGAQSPESIMWMRSLYAILPGVLAIIGLILLKFYPMTQERAYKIQEELAARRRKYESSS